MNNKQMEFFRRHISFSSPVTLGFAGVCFLVWLLGLVTGGASTHLAFSVYPSPLNIGAFFRLFLHVFGHTGFDHLAQNMALFLILSPGVERAYGSLFYALMLAVCAGVTGLFHLILSPGTALLGASGVVFMLIFLSVLSTRQTAKVPLTLILVAMLYFGRESAAGLFTRDNVSQLIHVIGGLCGIGFGLTIRPKV